MMRKTIYFLFIALLAWSCEKSDSLSSADRNVVSDDNSVAFEELLILLNVRTTDHQYLVVKSVDSVTIFINNYFWTRINSQVVDTSKIEKVVVGNKCLSDKKLNYLILARQQAEPPTFNTAGDYADYLNSVYQLQPGYYACLIKSLQVTLNDGSKETFFPFEYTTFKVDPDSRSAFVGEIEIILD